MMKVLTGLLLFLLSAIAAQGQAAQAPRVLAEISAGSQRVVKGSPFSAESVSESVQTLADGNRIVRKWTNKLYRNGEGRFRSEGSGPLGSALGATIMHAPSVTIMDPNGGYRYFLDTNSRTARSTTVPRRPITMEGRTVVVGGSEMDEHRVAVEVRAARGADDSAAVIARAGAPGAGGGVYSHGPATKFETKTESLGTQNFDGVDAEGTRTVTTIPADAIGNERPIEIVYERWYSKELQLIVYSKHHDPRFGEQTYRLTNINRSEPDPSLFELPAGYRILNEGPGSTRQTRIFTERVTPVSTTTPAVKAVRVKSATSGATKP